jgi:hypothetical protein
VKAAVRKTIGRMALGMEAKCHKHDGDWGTHGWLQCSREHLVDRFDYEVERFHQAINDGATTEEIWDKAFDVANLAMMTADNIESTRAGLDWENKGGMLQG